MGKELRVYIHIRIICIYVEFNRSREKKKRYLVLPIFLELVSQTHHTQASNTL